MRYLAAVLVLAMVAVSAAGCATVQTSVGKDKHGNPYFEQTIKGRSKAVIETAGQEFHGTLHVEPDTGALDVELNSGQEAEGVQAQGLDVIAGVAAAVAVQLMKTYGPPPPPPSE